MAETSEPMDSGEKRLNELGYKQELSRDLSLFKMFAMTMSTVTLFVGVVPYYSSALLYGGTVAIAYGWLVTAFFMFFVASALAEICSSFPTTGSLYFWAASLAGPKYSALASWITGWCEFIALAVGSGGSPFAATQLLQYIILVATGGANGGGYFLTKVQFLLVCYATTFIATLMNFLPVKYVAMVATFSMFLQFIGGLTILVGLPIIATKHLSASFVFSYFEDNRAYTGLPNVVYSWIAACLMSQYSTTGFDIAAHLTEETKRADISGPITIMGSYCFTIIFAYFFALSLTFSIGDINRVFDPETVTGGGYPVIQIIWDAFNDRFGSAAGAYVFFMIMYISFFLTCFSVLMVAGRVTYAFSRDGGIPLSFIWRRLNKDKVPIYGTILCAVIGDIVITPLLKSNQVFYAVSSMTIVAYVAAYLPPFFFRIRNPEASFNAGPFALKDYVGKYSKVVHVIAFLWISYTCIVFMLPTFYPITWENFNFAPVTIAIFGTLILIWWVVDARKWFKGPVRLFEVKEVSKVEENTFMSQD